MKDWEKLKGELQYPRPQAMYDREIHRFHSQLAAEHFSDELHLKQDFLDSFDRWLQASRLNRLTGLESLPHRDFMTGVTQFIDDLHLRYPRELVILENDYAYHWRLRPDIPRREPEQIQTGEVLVLSMPFCSLGDIHPKTQMVLDHCWRIGVPVHIDSAWYGCTREIEFDYSHPAILSSGFSCSKGLGLGANRVGVRYARERARGPITIINDFNMEIRVLMWYAIRFMDHFGPDYLQNKYGEVYREACAALGLEPTKAIHLAMRPNPNGTFEPVGMRNILRHLADF